MGYYAFAADIYGVEATQEAGTNVTALLELYTFYRENFSLYVQRIEAGLEEAKGASGVDQDECAVIGVSTALCRSRYFALRLLNLHYSTALEAPEQSI